MTALLLRFATPLLLWLAAVLVITEFLGWLFAWPAAFGGLRVGSGALYWPGQFLVWRPLLDADDRWMVDAAAGLCALGALALIVRVTLDLRDRQGHGFGAARWAARADVRRSGLQ